MGCPDPSAHQTEHIGSKHLPVQHVTQRSSWDCGLACTLMVLQSFGVQSQLEALYQSVETKSPVCDCYDQHTSSLAVRLSYMPQMAVSCLCKAPECENWVCCSVWTVDLAHLLSNHGCLVTFLTVTVGTNPEYASERFYARSMNSDKFRVERLFQQAQQAGILISVRSVDWQEIRDWLTDECLVIVLVDKCKLRHSQEEGHRMCPPACCCGLIRFSYRGHYIVLTGFDERFGMFKMEDPSATCSSSISPGDLDAARLAFGTDEDLLVVSKCQPGALRSGFANTELGNVYLQSQLPALGANAASLNQVQKACDHVGISEAKSKNGMVQSIQMQRLLQTSSRDIDERGSSQERESLFPGRNRSIQSVL